MNERTAGSGLLGGFGFVERYIDVFHVDNVSCIYVFSIRTNHSFFPSNPILNIGNATPASASFSPANPASHP